MILWLVACTSQMDARTRFEKEVVPVFEQRCADSSCHGVAPDAEARGEVIDWDQWFLRLDADGKIADVDAAREASLARVDTVEDPAWSTLLRKPLARAYGGLGHAGGENLLSPDDPAYQAIRAWIEAEDGGGEDPTPLTTNQQLFADTVQPVLAARGCMESLCHGTDAAIPFRLDPGLGGTFPASATQANYAAARTMLALDGDPSQSRLARKALPLWNGGIRHKGGNTSFLLDRADPGYTAILAWACAERETSLGVGCDPVDRGFVYVRGPVAAEDPFDLDQDTPGTDIWWAEGDRDENLTAGLHDAPADVRDPAVDETGTKLLFSMREDGDAGHRVWLMDLDTREARALTGPGDWTDRDPTWGPDGHVWFVSTRAGTLADDGRPDAELYELDPDSGALTRRTWTPHIERKPSFLVHGEENGGEVVFTALRAALPDQRRAHPFRMPPDLATEYHQHFGITPPEDLFHDVRELPDGRYLALVGDLDNAWEGGRLAVVDRNFGPEIPDGADPAIPNYRDPITRLDDDSAASGVTGRLYRDPAPLPDGDILVAVADGPIDLADPDAPVRFHLERLTLAETPDGSGPIVAARRVLRTDTFVSYSDPEPVVVRQPAPMAATIAWDPNATTGILRHQGLPMIDAILSGLPPSGQKSTRDDIVGVRLVEALPCAAADRGLVGDGPGATTTGLTAMSPARVLAELPLEDDGTFQAEIPAGVPFRLQALDGEGRAVGKAHNRWYFLAPGQVLSQGVQHENLDVYGARCAACHGAYDGDPDHVFDEPDILTTASLTLARYEGQDPRLPRTPSVVGDATRVEVDWRADVLPVLVSRCGGCHAELADTPTEHYDVAYEFLLGGWVKPGSARQSRVVEVVTGEELDADGAPLEAAHGGLSEAETLALTRWIDLGATWVGSL